MKESTFYKMCDVCEAIQGDTTNGYFPTVAEWKAHNVEEKIEFFAPFIIFYASDPFKRMGREKTPEYEETVKYCKELLTKISLE